MKRILLMILMLVFSYASIAQQVHQDEYFELDQPATGDYIYEARDAVIYKHGYNYKLNNDTDYMIRKKIINLRIAH